jgi:hypothetical protein
MERQSHKTPADAPAQRAASPRTTAERSDGTPGAAVDHSPRILAQRQAIQALQQSPAMAVQQQRAESLTRAAADNASVAGRSGVVQGAFIVNHTQITGNALKTWLGDFVKPDQLHVAAMVRRWDADGSHTTDYADDIAAYTAAKTAAEDKDEILQGNETVAGAIQAGDPQAVPWASVRTWAAWYFNGLEYQDNSTGGWHSNRQGWLPGGATEDGHPTRYVEFRRPGTVGKKDADKLERCIFDLLTGRCWPNAHYESGYVEITGVPAAFKNRMLEIAYVATGMKARADEMDTQETQEAGNGFDKIRWLLATLAKEAKK